LDYGMEVDYDLAQAISPLACAISRRMVDFSRFLLDKGANPNGRYTFAPDTFLGAAARHMNPDLLNLLIEHGALLQGSQALRQAAEYRRICNAQRLLELGVDVDEVFTRPEDEPWGCALHFAINGGQLNIPVTDSPVEMIKFLLQHGAQVDIRDGDGKTPLELAQEAGETELVQLFMQNGLEQ